MAQPRKQKDPRGRPPKFLEPSRPVTVTLPDRTLDLLPGIHQDRALALAKAVDLACKNVDAYAPVEIVTASKGLGIILVRACKALALVPSLTLVEVTHGRFLLALPPGSSADTLEVELLDVMDDLVEDDPDRPLLEELRKKIAGLRRSRRVQRAEILFVEMK
jgi:hypothetical protein